MNIIKKITLVLPIIAIGLFIFTLSVIDKKEGSTPAGINIYTSVSETSTTTYVKPKEKSKETIIIKKEGFTVTDAPATPVSEITEIPITKFNIPASIVTPFSKLPELQPLEKIQPVPVVTPSEIVLESIPLINHNTTTSLTEETTYDDIMSESELHTGTDSKLPSETDEPVTTSVPETKIND